MSETLHLAEVGEGDVVLDIEDLKVHFPLRGHDKVHAVDGVSFELFAGETLGLIGESGSGKSTVSRAILQLLKPTAGRITFRGADLHELSAARRRELRRHVQMIFQDPHASLDPRKTILESVREPMRVQRIGSKSEQLERSTQLLERVGLNTHHAQRYPHQLSGGQKQRVSIARALTLRPDVLLCDEPVSALDVALQAEILNLFADIQAEFGLSSLFITHDLSVVAHIADRVGVMYLGRLMELGPVARVVDHPVHPYSDALLAAQPQPLPSRLRTEERRLLEGDIPSPVHPPSGCRFRTRCPFADDRCAAEEPTWREVESGHWVACHFAGELPLRGAAAAVSINHTGDRPVDTNEEHP
ncbi:MAG: ABC transporter ATP-binding protein [Desertimonas sp.]